MGDVIGITESDGNIIAAYNYDEWGNVLSTDFADEENTEQVQLANANPLRYRGYYQDAETGYYYLQSRYYDPSICRFINADAFQLLYLTKNDYAGINMFAYCNNDPVNRIDIGGMVSYRTTIKTTKVSTRNYNFTINASISFKKIRNMIETKGLVVALLGVVALFIPEPSVSKIVGAALTITGAVYTALGYILSRTSIGNKTVRLRLSVKGKIITYRKDYTVYKGKKVTKRYYVKYKQYNVTSIGGSIKW